MTLLSFLGFMAVVLTVAMFATRQSMLGFPSAIFWAITGAQAYTLSTVPWGDIYYYIAFASLLGMTSFTALGAFGLREKRDTLADEGMDDDSKVKDDSFIDEHEKEADTDYWSGKDGETPLSGSEAQPSDRAVALRRRAKERRSRGQSRRKGTPWGEFK